MYTLYTKHQFIYCLNVVDCVYYQHVQPSRNHVQWGNRITSRDLDLQRHMSFLLLFFLRWLFVLLMLAELMTITTVFNVFLHKSSYVPFIPQDSDDDPTKTQTPNLIRATRFWNNLHQVLSVWYFWFSFSFYSKDWKAT